MLTAPTNLRMGVGDPPPPPPSTNPHAYFEWLLSQPELLTSWSLRSQAQLNSLTNRGTSYFWRYLYGTGQTHPYATSAPVLDAAMLGKPPRSTFSTYPDLAAYGNSGDERVPGDLTLRIPLGITSGTVLITWDVYWGQEFQTNAGWDNNPVNAWKTFFLYAGAGLGGTEGQWLGHDHIGNARSTPGLVSLHHEGIGSKLVAIAPGMVARDPLNPTGPGAATFRTFGTYYNRWTRYWLEYRMSVPGSQFTEWSQAYLSGTPLAGTWDMVSLWIADEQRNATRVFYRVPAGRRAIDTMLAQFRFSWDTSTNNINGGGLVGPVVAYARNMVILRNGTWSENDTFLFSKPVA